MFEVLEPKIIKPK